MRVRRVRRPRPSTTGSAGVFLPSVSLDLSAAVQGALAVSRRLDGRRVLLIDDVCTMGACAQPLMLTGDLTLWSLPFVWEV